MIYAIAFVIVVASCFGLILVGSIHRARQQKKLYDAAEKYLKS
jgi:hypothetical protein